MKDLEVGYLMLNKGFSIKDIEKEMELENISKLEIYRSHLLGKALNDDSIHINYECSFMEMIELFYKEKKDCIDDFFIEECKKIENKWLKMELFYHFLKKEDFSRAVQFLEEALIIDNDFIPGVINKIHYIYDTEFNCFEIIQDIEKVIDFYQDFEVLTILGVAYYNCYNDDVKAINYLNKSIEIKPSSYAYYFIGFIKHYKHNEKKIALEYYKKSVELDRNNLEAVNELGWLYFDSKKLEKAKELFLLLEKKHFSQELSNPIIRFHIITKNFLKASEIIENSINEFGMNFFNKGYELIIKILLKNSFEEGLKVYKNQYGDNAINWLKDEFELIRESNE